MTDCSVQQLITLSHFDLINDNEITKTADYVYYAI